MFVQLTREFLGKPPGERIDVSEADAKQLVEQGVAVAVADDPLGSAAGRAFESALGRLSEAVAKAVDGALKSVVDAGRRCRKNAAPLLFGEGREGDMRRSFGDWLLCVRRGDRKALAERYDSHLVGWGQEGEGLVD